MIIIGRNPVLEAIKFNSSSIEKIILLNNPTDNKIKEILNHAKENNIAVEISDKDGFIKYFDSKNKSEGISQGIIAQVSEFEYADFDISINELSKNDNSTIVLIDEIQDPHNLGAIIRTSSAACVDLIILTAKNTAKINHTVIKTSSGATNYIKIAQIRSIYDTISRLKTCNFDIVGTSLKSDINLHDYKFNVKTVLVFGNEGSGLRTNILRRCDNIIKIPIENKKIDSLNVSVSAGIILYERLRQLKEKNK
jgi:23S rRNA (guanosine2251-2'-O)-methyltransferase